MYPVLPRASSRSYQTSLPDFYTSQNRLFFHKQPVFLLHLIFIKIVFSGKQTLSPHFTPGKYSAA
jgi:hypothetical protein